ncbi:hypothetical protein Dimus_035364 [Dionaea muscipula]
MRKMNDELGLPGGLVLVFVVALVGLGDSPLAGVDRLPGGMVLVFVVAGVESCVVGGLGDSRRSCLSAREMKNEEDEELGLTINSMAFDCSARIIPI